MTKFARFDIALAAASVLILLSFAAARQDSVEELELLSDGTLKDEFLLKHLSYPRIRQQLWIGQIL